MATGFSWTVSRISPERTAGTPFIAPNIEPLTYPYQHGTCPPWRYMAYIDKRLFISSQHLSFQNHQMSLTNIILNLQTISHHHRRSIGELTQLEPPFPYPSASTHLKKKWTTWLPILWATMTAFLFDSFLAVSMCILSFVK